MNDFYNELIEYAQKRNNAAKSTLERSVWGRILKYLELPNNTDPNKPYKYALYIAFAINNRSPYHNRTIRTRRKIQREFKTKRKLPQHLHNRMILESNEYTKEYAQWIMSQHNHYYPI